MERGCVPRNRFKSTVEQQMTIAWSWFNGWTDEQKYAFLDELVEKVVSRPAVCSLYRSLQSLSIQRMNSDTFSCQLRMFNGWFQEWSNQERNVFVEGLEGRHHMAAQYFSNKVKLAAIGALN